MHMITVGTNIHSKLFRTFAKPFSSFFHRESQLTIARYTVFLNDLNLGHCTFRRAASKKVQIYFRKTVLFFVPCV